MEKFPVAKAAGLVEEEGEGKLGTLLLLGLLKLPASAVFCAGNRFNGIPPPSKGSLSEVGEPKFSSEELGALRHLVAELRCYFRAVG